jgi:hypothetical protein
MKKVLLIISLLVLVVLGFLAYRIYTTKSHSPEANVEFADGNLQVHVFYNRPFKRGREIFGGLVPFDRVWRTGANEASYLETNQTLNFGGKELKPGKYSLWTIPSSQSWTIILNSEYPSWGVSFDGEPNYKEAADALRVEVPAVLQDKEIEQFTISVEKVDEGYELIFMWDKTLVIVPFRASGQ